MLRTSLLAVRVVTVDLGSPPRLQIQRWRRAASAHYASVTSDTTDGILSGLNDAQRAAVTADLAHIRVQAGPGTGKTRVLANRIAFMNKELAVPLRDFLAVTFTNKAKSEMKKRLDKLLGESGVHCTTLHAFCVTVLRMYSPVRERGFIICNDQDSKKLVKNILGEMGVDMGENGPGRVRDAISMLKRECLSTDTGTAKLQFADSFYQLVHRVMHKYNEALRMNNAKDFDDLIGHTLRLLRADAATGTADGGRRSEDEETLAAAARSLRQRYKHVLCDEWQDVSKSEYELLKALVQPAPLPPPPLQPSPSPSSPPRQEPLPRTLFVVGDSNQTIYSWRGADHRNMQKFSDDYPGVLSFELHKNYRSDKAIIAASRSIIDKGPAGARERLRGVGIEAGSDAMSQVTDGPDDVRQYDPDGSPDAIGTAVLPSPATAELLALLPPPTAAAPSPAVQVVCAYNDLQQAEYIAHTIDYLVSTDQVTPSEVAIMYRRHSQSDHLQSALFKRRIKFTVVGGTGNLDRKEVKDALAYLRLLANARDGEALRRVINYPPRGVGTKTADKFFTAVADASAAAAAAAFAPLPVVDFLIELGLVVEEMKDKAPARKRGRKAAEDGRDTAAERLAASLSPRQLNALHEASSVVAALRRTTQTWQGGVAELVDEVLTASGLRDHIRTAKGVSDSDKEEKLARLDQLASAARLFDQDVDVGASPFLATSNADGSAAEGGDREEEATGALWRLRRYLDSFQLSSGEEAEDESGPGEDPRDGCVRLMTLHASKGLEFDCVFIAGLEEKTLPMEGAMRVVQVDHPAEGGAPSVVSIVDSPELQLDEERRLMYVGMTRARRRLFLCHREFDLTKDGLAIPVSPSRFLKDLPNDTPKMKYRPPPHPQRNGDFRTL